MLNNYIENEYAKLWVENDILFVVYKSDVSIDLAGAIKIVEDRLFLQEGKAFLIFCDMRGVKSADKAARNYLALEGSVLIKAVALLINNPLSYIISGFYLKTSKPIIFTKVFTDDAEALAFLRSFT
ncbi:hypothetical protein CJ739_1755 [Mariniflexile rhizosphaerae]|uniref:DUF7793 family protein n=1 Tax=unclassified Mariniflexile TaxID=2643887 RepID=UPI000E3369F1|nr:hypothetical protein [Mariniflexile sp. TRM1-10]AXP80841.1 hypothetical protein CJ739_1755 [Mariniflexile sp. TRM1-10]